MPQNWYIFNMIKVEWSYTLRQKQKPYNSCLVSAHPRAGLLESVVCLAVSDLTCGHLPWTNRHCLSGLHYHVDNIKRLGTTLETTYGRGTRLWTGWKTVLHTSRSYPRTTWQHQISLISWSKSLNDARYAKLINSCLIPYHPRAGLLLSVDNLVSYLRAPPSTNRNSLFQSLIMLLLHTLLFFLFGTQASVVTGYPLLFPRDPSAPPSVTLHIPKESYGPWYRRVRPKRGQSVSQILTFKPNLYAFHSFHTADTRRAY